MFKTNINPIIFELGPIQIRLYGLDYVAGIFNGKLYINCIITHHIHQHQHKLKTIMHNFEPVLLMSILLGGKIG